MMFDADAFRRDGRAMIEFIADYLESVERYPVLSQVQPGAVRGQLSAEPPRRGESLAAMLDDVQRVIMPGVTHWQSPNFFGYFPANVSGPAILGELLSAGLGVQGMLWSTSPACTELETHVLDWLVDMLALPAKFKSSSSGGGVMQDTASSASLVAMIAARERATKLQSNRTGVPTGMTAYTSSQAHSSIEKTAGIIGIGRENLRAVDVDDAFAMKADALRAMIERDVADGKRPFCVCATVGTTSSNAIDPVADIAEVCREHDIWLHVDAAMSGTAALCPEFQFLHDGVEQADSYCFNPHKWMLTNFDCSCFWVADRQMLIDSLSILPEYLRNQATESGAVFDYRDWQIPLGRRFRALKLWFVIRHFGVEGLQQHVREGVQAAQWFAEQVRGSAEFELVVEPPLNLVCFRHRSDDAFNEKLLGALNDSGRLFLTHTKLNDRFTLRLAVGGTLTEQRHVEAAWAVVQEMADELARK